MTAFVNAQECLKEPASSAWVIGREERYAGR